MTGREAGPQESSLLSELSGGGVLKAPEYVQYVGFHHARIGAVPLGGQNRCPASWGCSVETNHKGARSDRGHASFPGSSIVYLLNVPLLCC